MSFKLCIKDSQGISKSHDPVTVDYAIVGGNLLLVCIASKRRNFSQDNKQFLKPKKEKKNEKGQVFWTYTHVVKLLKNVVFCNSSDLSLAPHAEWGNIFPQNVLF